MTTISLRPYEHFSTWKATPWIPQKPFGSQFLFLCLNHVRETFFGGAAGGGKTDVLLMAAAQYVDEPGYSALILRRTYPQLSSSGKGIIPRSREWWAGTGARFNESTHTWTFPSGATVRFGSMQHENDKYNYQGPEFQFIGFDELTQFSLTQYLYMFSRLRRLEGSPIPLRVRSTSNPGGVGHEWVKRRLVAPETRRDDTVFIPSRIEDNIYLSRAEYMETLQELDPVTQAQLLRGDWDIRPEGNLFPPGKFKIVAEAPAECEWTRFWDLAATSEDEGRDPDYTAGCLLGVHGGLYYMGHMARWRKNPGETEADIKTWTAAAPPNTRHRMEREGGASGKNTAFHYARLVLPGIDFLTIPSTGSKVERARPASAAVNNGLVHLVDGPWLTDFLDEVAQFPTAGVHDDQVDAFSGALSVLRPIQVAQFSASRMEGGFAGALVSPTDNPLNLDLRLGSKYRDVDVEYETVGKSANVRRSVPVPARRRRR